MRNVLLEQTMTFVNRLLLMLAVYLLWRGHNEPGGGFIAGIMASIGYVFYAIVFGTDGARKRMIASPFTFIGLGLLTSVTSAFIPLLQGKAPLTGLWTEVVGVALGTPLLFDIGVFMVVFGIITAIVLTIIEVLEWN